MNLEIIRTQTTWNDAAGSINSNYAKIADAIAQLKANGGGGGSGADIDLTAYATKVWVEAKGYITASALTPYALKEDIPSLVGYATEDFVNSKLGDYATKDWVGDNYLSLSGGTIATAHNAPLVVRNLLSGNAPVSIGLQRNETLPAYLVYSGDTTWSVTDPGWYHAYEIFHQGNYSDLLSGSIINGSITATSFIGNLTGNADSATKLKTLCKLWGNDFDGTGDVSGSLDVSGNIKASGDITANKFIGYLRGDIIYDNGVDEGHFIGLGSNGVGVKGLLNYVYGNFPILFYTNGFERMRIGEYVGIGTTSPSEKLEVNGNAKIGGDLIINGQMYVGNELHIEHPTTGRQLSISPYWTILGYNNPMIGNPTYIDGRNVYIRYGNDEYVSTFASNGNVGIGNTSPTERLDVSGNIKASGNINATSITINGVTITASNGSITVNGNVIATGDITGGV